MVVMDNLFSICRVSTTIAGQIIVLSESCKHAKALSCTKTEFLIVNTIVIHYLFLGTTKTFFTLKLFGN